MQVGIARIADVNVRYCEGQFYGTVVFERLPGALPEMECL